MSDPDQPTPDQAVTDAGTTSATTVNGQVDVPAGGQMKVSAPCGSS